MVGEAEAHQRGSERHGGVHGGAGEGAGGEDVGSHDQTDRDGRDDPDLALLRVHGGGVHGVHEPEGRRDLEHERRPHRDSGHAECRDGLQGKFVIWVCRKWTDNEKYSA